MLKETQNFKKINPALIYAHVQHTNRLVALVDYRLIDL